LEIVRYRAIVEEIFQAWIPKERISTEVGPQPVEAIQWCFEAALKLRMELGYGSSPAPPVEKYLDLSYYRKALSIGSS
jgi:hypothetical protein